MAKLRLIHQWTGLLLSIIILAVVVSGAVLLFADDLHRAAYPVLKQPVSATLTGYSDTLREIETYAGGAVLTLIKFPQPGMNAFRCWFGDHSEAFVHPDSGDIIAHWRWYESLPGFLFELHAHLLMGETGEIINGVVAFAVLFLAGSGILLWWRRHQHFRLSYVFPSHFNAASILRCHTALGITCVAPVILFVTTGLLLVFYTPAAAVLTNLLDDRPPAKPDVIVIPGNKPMWEWEQILAGIEKIFPEGQLVYYYPPGPDNAAMIFRKRLPGEWHPNGRSYIVIDPYRGEVVQAIDARQEEPGVRIMNTVYPLHAARIGGPAYKTIALLGALTLALLACTGIIAYSLRLARVLPRQSGLKNRSRYKFTHQ